MAKHYKKLNKLMVNLVKLWTMPVFRYGVKNDEFFVQVYPILEPKKGIDERIRSIDNAREHLIASLSVIDDLKMEAESSSEKVSELNARLEKLALQKQSADSDLQEIRKIASSNIDVFKKVAGIPSRAQIAKERIVGFFLGVIASIIATLVWEKWPILISWFQA